MKLAVLLIALGMALVGCSGEADSDARDGGPRLVVGAASSLREPLTACAGSFRGATVNLSVAGSDTLAAQIRQGAPIDVYVAANTELPRALAREGLVERPRAFATNELVVAVPSDASGVRSLADLARPGVEVGLAAESVPAGSYARAALDRLPAGERKRILANVRSEEPDVTGVVGKLLQGALDAGLVYRTDVGAVDGRLRTIRLAPRLRPAVVAAAATVRASDRIGAARRYVGGLLHGACQRALERAGFGPRPR